MNIKPLVDRSIYVLREVKARFKNPCILYSTGKDSTTLLNLVREAFFGEIPFDVVFIDTGFQFKEMYDFLEFIRGLWGFNLVRAKHPLAGKIDHKVTSFFDCCNTLKTQALRTVIEKHGYDAVIAAIRRDEHYIRNLERVFSPRDRSFRWKIIARKKNETGDSPFLSLQPVELWNLYQTRFLNVHHVRVHPLLWWSEVDVWRYILNRKLPVNPLYFSRGGYRYRSLGCKCCTFPVPSKAKTIKEIIREIEESKTSEREGRIQDKEKIMRKLRALGYM